jgi:uncharacterized protein YheU (UPF0270 family)
MDLHMPPVAILRLADDTIGEVKFVARYKNSDHMNGTDDYLETGSPAAGEEPLEIPMDRINPDTLRSMIEEFVTREWNELADSADTLDEKVEQVFTELRDSRARIVYDGTSETWNIIPCR